MNPALARISAAAVQPSLDALKSYDTGSDRGALVPLDEAVAAAAGDAAAARQIEPRLIEVLQRPGSSLARDYACRKLAVIGSAAAVPALAALLSEAALGHEARNALQVMTCPEAGQALLGALPRLSGRARTAAIASLGMRRETCAVEALTGLLENADPEVVEATLAALGNIGDDPAAQALLPFLPKAQPACQPAAADACLACAERLAARGNPRLAAELYRALAGPEQPRHVQSASRAGLARLEAPR